MRLEELGEFGFLGRIWPKLAGPVHGMVLGSGDDAAVLARGESSYLLVSTDAVVEGRHFRREWLSPEQIGYRAGAAALSDLAAMGGRARGLLASAALPPTMPVEEAEALVQGLDNAAVASGTRLMGGDLTASPGPIYLDVVVLGETNNYWARAGAQVGDAVLVSGDLGQSAVALAWLESGRGVERLSQALSERFLTPRPRFDLVQAVHPLVVVTSAIDISDGLVSDLGHIAAASDVQLAIEAARVPIVEETRAVAQELGLDLMASVLSSGEEYEIAFTVPAEAVEQVKAVVIQAGAGPVTVIGQVRAGKGVVVEGAQGVKEGYDHFKHQG